LCSVLFSQVRSIYNRKSQALSIIIGSFNCRQEKKTVNAEDISPVYKLTECPGIRKRATKIEVFPLTLPKRHQGSPPVRWWIIGTLHRVFLAIAKRQQGTPAHHQGDTGTRSRRQHLPQCYKPALGCPRNSYKALISPSGGQTPGKAFLPLPKLAYFVVGENHIVNSGS
jgi:hypothetical protein